MKSIILLSAALLAGPLAQSKIERDGGMSGGGGYVLNPEINTQANHPAEVQMIIENSAIPILKNYFYEKSQMMQSGLLPESQVRQFKRLLSSKGSIFKILNETRVFVQANSSCYGPNGEPTDGSFFVHEHKGICLSARNIAVKVTNEDLQPQTAALMAHEYSEIMGFSDDEAIDLQKLVLSELK
jgi:hypothetical protein